MSDADDMENAYDAAVELTQHANEVVRENERLRSQLAALQAEAAKVVGPLLNAPTAAGTAARDFVASLPSPAVVAVPIEPGDADIEAMVDQMERLPYSAVLQDAALAAFRALVKRHGG